MVDGIAKRFCMVINLFRFNKLVFCLASRVENSAGDATNEKNLFFLIVLVPKGCRSPSQLH